MYVDAQNRFSNDQSLAGAAATTVATNVLDLQSANKNLGIGIEGRIVAFVTTAFAGGTSVKCEAITSASADMSSPTVVATGATVVTASAIDGATLLDVKLPNTTQRYISVRYTTVGTTTTGTVFAGIVAGTDHMPFPPANTGL